MCMYFVRLCMHVVYYVLHLVDDTTQLSRAVRAYWFQLGLHYSSNNLECCYDFVLHSRSEFMNKISMAT